MIGALEALVTPVVVVVAFGLTVWVIKADLTGIRKEMGDMAKTITDIRLALKDCVTWEELARELGPIRVRGEDHEKRIGAIEVTCKQQHKGD